MTLSSGDDALILAAIDLAGNDAWIELSWDRATASMSLGLAGDIRQMRLPGLGLAARAERRLPSGRTPQVRPHEFHAGADGSWTLLAGRIHHPGETATRFAVGRWADHASLYSSLFQRLGPECDRRIAGDYAVVQWFPATRRLRLVRSPTAHAPLHVWREGDRIVVCSSPNPVLAFGLVPRIDPRRVGGWLLAGAGPPERSFYEGMTCVVCGTCEEHDPQGRCKRRYWSIRDVPKVHLPRDDDYVDAVVEQLRRATEATLAGAAAPAVLLSGGFDSQAVAAFSLEQIGPDRPLLTYTSVPAAEAVIENPDTSFADEGPYVRALAAMYPQIKPTFVDGADLHFGQRLQSLMLMAGWPMFNEMNAHWYHQALERAAADGADVVMTGDAGNVGFSYDGLTGFPTWLAQGNWRRLLKELRAYPGDERPLWRKLISRAVMPHLPQNLKWAIDRNRGWRELPFETWCALREDHAQESGLLEEADAEGFDLHAYDFASSRQWRDVILNWMYSGGSEINLGFSLLYGVAICDVHSYVPLLELCAGIADDQYLHDGQDRWLGRRVLQGRVPDIVWQESWAGRQSSDWPMRLLRDRDMILQELESLARDERLARIIDFERLIRNLREWDGREVPGRGDAMRLISATCRGLATARFVRFAEGRNAG